jgi:hypothetical protein
MESHTREGGKLPVFKAKLSLFNSPLQGGSSGWRFARTLAYFAK